jgi:hypothetical protein
MHRQIGARREENTEVHITIGRVEVTAMYPPPPDKPASPAMPRRPPPMSLDEYLEKHHGRVS